MMPKPAARSPAKGGRRSNFRSDYDPYAIHDDERIRGW
jgi:hypothetical protein